MNKELFKQDWLCGTFDKATNGKFLACENNLLQSRFHCNATFAPASTSWTDHGKCQISMDRCCVYNLWSQCFWIGLILPQHKALHKLNFTHAVGLRARHSYSSLYTISAAIWLTHSHLCVQNYRIFLQHSYFAERFSQLSLHVEMKGEKCVLCKHNAITSQAWIRDSPALQNSVYSTILTTALLSLPRRSHLF